MVFKVYRHCPAGFWDPATYSTHCSENPKCEPGKGGLEDRFALTAHISLAYMGAGYDHVTPNQYKATVKKGIEYICSQQQPDGALANSIENHAFMLLALAEAFAMTNDKTLKAPCEKAMNWLLEKRIVAEKFSAAAWGTDKTVDTALSLVAVMAIKSCLAGGLDTKDAINLANNWWTHAWKSANPGWDNLNETSTTHFPATWTTDGVVNGDDTLSAILIAQFFNPDRSTYTIPSLMQTWQQQQPKATDISATPRIFWIGTLTNFIHGGKIWDSYADPYLAALVKLQRKDDGCFAGSWDPAADLSRGRLQSSVYFTLGMEIFYRYKSVSVKSKPDSE